MELDEFKAIKDWSNNFEHRVNDKRIWNGINGKLSTDRLKVRLIIYKWLSIAAVGLVFITSGLLFNQRKDSLSTTAVTGVTGVRKLDVKPIIMEDLSNQDDNFYNLATVRDLSATYQKDLSGKR